MSKRQHRDRIQLNAADAPLTVNPFADLKISATEIERQNKEGTISLFPDENRRSAKSRVILRRETAHRGGKVVIVVTAFPEAISVEEISALARELRIACGAGGTMRGREIEIQGDQVARIRAFFEGKGFRVGVEK